MSKTLGLIATIALSLTVSTPTAAPARVTAADCETAAKAVKAEIDAACPCDSAPAHTDHVRCVTKKLRELSSCGPGADAKRSCGSIPRVCVPKIRRVASRSACGQPEGTVTCCVGKQRD